MLKPNRKEYRKNKIRHKELVVTLLKEEHIEVLIEEMLKKRKKKR
jgi:hypothetical protein